MLCLVLFLVLSYIMLLLIIVLLMLIPGGYGVATGGPLAWGLCYNHEMSPSQDYCDDYFKYTYPCAPGAQYYGRGALPIFWCVYVLKFKLE